ncbi:MAG TPA: hypothetical protein VKZ59_11690 [Acidobacteriota bacterium]|nr:hypothetical protein [Acidobacteriota bacterium]
MSTKHSLLFFVLTALFMTPLFGQQPATLRTSDDARFWRRDWVHEFGGTGKTRRIGIFPIIHVPGSLARGLVLEHLVFGSPRGNAVRATRSTPFLFHSGLPAEAGLGFVGKGKTSSSLFFIERWKDFEPTKPMEKGETSSKLLKPGQSKEAVMRSLGSPVERIRFADKEIWKYSGYSLVFVSGLLQEVR